MDFHSSKENIQPLRGGRNVSQLDLALHAQENVELQRELERQKETFEQAIRDYDGPDPLKNWYEYIAWAEQTFPKHGILLTLLEDCLSKFEHDKRYYNDRRLCKLFIKYIDMQQNPIELFQLMHARGLCRGITDLYRAWAYYHEAAADYVNADAVFQLGRRELAQPTDELDTAHNNLIFAVGVYVISGVNHSRLNEQRMALTSLHTYKPGNVGSVRLPNGQAPVLPTQSGSGLVANSVVSVYDDDATSQEGATAVLPSLISIAKRQDPKENLMQPGTWTQGMPKKFSLQQAVTPFKVHEDRESESLLITGGIRLPPKFYPETRETYDNWVVDVYFKEPPDSKLRMYPKAIVYGTPLTEFSMEEIKARKYPKHPKATPAFVHQEPQDIPEHLPQHLAEHLPEHLAEHLPEHLPGHLPEHLHEHVPEHVSENVLQNIHNAFQDVETVNAHLQYVIESHDELPFNPNPAEQQGFEPFAFYTDEDANKPRSEEGHLPLEHQHYVVQQYQEQEAGFNYYQPNNVAVFSEQPQLPIATSYVNYATTDKDNFNVFENGEFDLCAAIFADSNASVRVPKGTSLKTPLKDISADDLAETGSRGGLEVAAAAQPCDEARPIPIYEDESNLGNTVAGSAAALDESLNTRIFKFHMSNDNQSTPNVKYSRASLIQNVQPMSVIVEDTNGFSSNDVASKEGAQSWKPAVDDQNSYHYNLAQNSKANEQLRSSIYEFMDCESHPSSPVTESLPAPLPLPMLEIKPLEAVPSNPFKPALIKSLLDVVGFPGRHKHGYKQIYSVPKMSVKKDVVCIGLDKYFVEKILGKGTYGSVFKAVNKATRETVALKLQKPPNKWEFYICRELHARLEKHPLKECFMDVQVGYYCEQGSIIVSQYGPNGSLLDLVNTIKQKFGRTMKESMCIFFCIEMLKIVQAMHEVKIIHADIKPDNFLVFLQENRVKLQLIDFGCSIDMSLFPEGATFVRQVKTENFTCCEMLDGRPWSYHTDLFCIGASVHVMLFDKYLTVQKIDNQWSLTQKFTRYWNVSLWSDFFSAILNQQDSVANTRYLQMMLEDNLHGTSEFQNDLRAVTHILKNR